MPKPLPIHPSSRNTNKKARDATQASANHAHGPGGNQGLVWVVGKNPQRAVAVTVAPVIGLNRREALLPVLGVAA